MYCGSYSGTVWSATCYYYSRRPWEWTALNKEIQQCRLRTVCENCYSQKLGKKNLTTQISVCPSVSRHHTALVTQIDHSLVWMDHPCVYVCLCVRGRIYLLALNKHTNGRLIFFSDCFFLPLPSSISLHTFILRLRTAADSARLFTVCMFMAVSFGALLG